MFSDKIKYIKKARDEDKLIIFVGAGISKNSNLPDWEQLIKVFVDKLNYPISEGNKLSSDEYLKIPQYYYNIYGNDMEVTLHFSEDGLWCLEGKYELGETDVVTEIQNEGWYGEGQSVETPDYTAWYFETIQEVSYQDKAFSEVNCAEVREYPDGTGQLILTLEKIPAENIETE